MGNRQMRYKEIIAEAVWEAELSEAFDQPRGIDWEQSDESEAVDAIARLSDGTALSVMFEPEAWTNDSPTDWSVSFWRGNSQEVTGAGNAQEVFATVLSAIRQFVHSHNPESISFSASKEPEVDMAQPGANVNPESRAKLYDRMVNRYASAMGYSVTQREGNGKVTYTLRRTKQSVAEAPLADYVPMGDFNKPGPFRGADKKLVPHPVNQLKAQRFFEKTPYNFRLFFSNIPGTGKYSEYGVMDPDTVKIIFGDAGEQIVAGHEDAITVVYVGNSGDSKVMLTPWMMAHRLGHAMQSGTRGRSNNQQHPWKAGEDHFFGQVNSMLEEYYGKSGQRGGNLKAELTPEYNALFNAIGTQRSSRSGEIRRPYEFLYEIFAQYLGTGTVTFNALPANLGYGRKAWGNPSRYLNINPEYRDESARKQATEVLSYDMELMFNDALSNAEGKILVM
jgi:hypothetical protein